MIAVSELRLVNFNILPTDLKLTSLVQQNLS